uniref:NF-kappa-B inhibitor-interacting Ras-like protein 1 n=1 Tax=Sphaerodactylus townsendi TaxID=933632 RepID=A0ACB8FVE4_9SAUR
MGKGYKVVVCGMASVGKTAILEQILYGNHTVGMECSSTVEDVYVALAETDRGVKEQLRLYDTKGVEGVEQFPRHYFSIADGFVLVYAVNSLESFQKLDQLKNEIDKLKDKKETAGISFREERCDKNPKGDNGDIEHCNKQRIEGECNLMGCAAAAKSDLSWEK